jgi:uncharacterized protein YbaP (TraB family)
MVAILLPLLAAAADAEPEEFTVVGRYPGPPLWKVSSGANELWIFGIMDTIPRDMTWDSMNVERVLGDSQELLLPPGVRARTPNPFKMFGLYRQARRLSRNADDTLLADVLPPDLYSRYSAMRDRYARGARDLERQRPAIVALRLYADAIDAAGLTSGRKIQKAVERIARQARIATTETEIRVAAGTLLDAAADLSTQAEIECFATIIASIETDLPDKAERARAWANGDIAALRSFDYPDIRSDCLSFAASAEGLRETMENSAAQWLEAAEHALSVNASTFAALDIGELVSPEGLLARLRERGYIVREPQ